MNYREIVELKFYRINQHRQPTLGPIVRIESKLDNGWGEMVASEFKEVSRERSKIGEDVQEIVIYRLNQEESFIINASDLEGLFLY